MAASIGPRWRDRVGGEGERGGFGEGGEVNMEIVSKNRPPPWSV